MKTSKSRSKSKGFTLIELMVVISIIALLSSIVLASVSAAREKAILTKTVSEMKSLQTAVELYRNQFGVYPGDSNTAIYDDSNVSVNNTTANGFFNNSNNSIESFFQTELVNRKMISKVPHAPRWPDNCGSDCNAKGYVLGYSVYNRLGSSFYKNETNTSSYNATCGNQKINNYVIYFITPLNLKLNLPEYNVLVPSLGYQNLNFFSMPSKTYCIAG